MFTAKHVLKCFAESEILSVTLDLCLNLFTSKTSLMITSGDCVRCKENTEWLEFLSQTAKPKCPIYYILLCFSVNKPVVGFSSWSHPDISDIISNPLHLLFPMGFVVLVFTVFVKTTLTCLWLCFQTLRYVYVYIYTHIYIYSAFKSRFGITAPLK